VGAPLAEGAEAHLGGELAVGLCQRHGAAQVVFDGIQQLGLGPAGVDDGQARKAERAPQAGVPRHRQPLGPLQVVHALARLGDGLFVAGVVGAVVEVDGVRPFRDLPGLAEGGPVKAAPRPAAHLAARGVAVVAAVTGAGQRMRAGTARPVAVGGAIAVQARLGAVAARIVGVAAGEGCARARRAERGADQAVERIVAGRLGASASVKLIDGASGVQVAEPVPGGGEMGNLALRAARYRARGQTRGLVVAAGDRHTVALLNDCCMPPCVLCRHLDVSITVAGPLQAHRVTLGVVGGPHRQRAGAAGQRPVTMREPTPDLSQLENPIMIDSTRYALYLTLTFCV